MGGQPLAQRLRDKEHTWEDLRKLVPGMLNLGLMGYPFGCPDLIGGGEYLSFQNLAAIDQELIVRAAQVHALMPMMQFSVAPWRVLSAGEPRDLPAHGRAAHRAGRGDPGPRAASRRRPASRSSARSSTRAPHRGYADVIDQFLLGPDILVAPVVEKGARKRPARRAARAAGRATTARSSLGPATIEIDAPLDRLPWYRRIGS